MENGFQIIGPLLVFIMVIFFYRHAIEDIIQTPKGSFLLAIPIIFLGILFYIFFKYKGF